MQFIESLYKRKKEIEDQEKFNRKFDWRIQAIILIAAFIIIRIKWNGSFLIVWSIGWLLAIIIIIDQRRNINNMQKKIENLEEAMNNLEFDIESKK